MIRSREKRRSTIYKSLWDLIERMVGGRNSIEWDRTYIYYNNSNDYQSIALEYLSMKL